MLVCLDGNLTISVVVRASLQFAVILLIIVQARSVAGQDPARQIQSSSQWISTTLDSAAAGQAASLSPLVFAETQIDDAREGHATLTWTTLAQASTYRVSDADGSVLYSGAFPQAFVSGLEDGKHLFSVVALDATGHLIAKSQVPAVVMVKHWPLAQALVLFAIGAIVFLALVIVLAYGAITCSNVEVRVRNCTGDSQP